MKKRLISLLLVFVMAFTMPSYLLASEVETERTEETEEKDFGSTEIQEELPQESSRELEDSAEEETEEIQEDVPEEVPEKISEEQENRDEPAEEAEPVQEDIDNLQDKSETEPVPAEDETETEAEEAAADDLTESDRGDSASESGDPVIYAKSPKRSDDPSQKYEDEEELEKLGTASAESYMAGNAQVLEKAVSGSIEGTNITWTLDTSGLLTISGSGALITGASADENSLSGNRPFTKYADYIQKVVIRKGITTVGNGAFAQCHSVRAVSLTQL